MVDDRKIGLQQFAEGGADGAATGENGGNSGLSGDFAADVQKYFGVTVSSDAGSNYGEKKTNAPENARAAGTGTDEGAASSGQQETQQTPQQEPQEDDSEYQTLRGKYDERIKGEFQKAFNERFKTFKQKEAALQKQLDGYRGMSALLTDKYGLDPDATQEQIYEAMRADNTNFSRQAMAAGMPTDAYRDQFISQQEQLQKQAEEQAAQAEQAARQQAADRDAYMRTTLDRWQKEAEELKETFPDFDLAKELRTNEDFKSDLTAGVPLKRAYLGTNFDRIASGLVAAATQQTAKKTAETLAANRTRPSEGGQSAGTGIQTGKRSANSLSDAEVLDIIDRAAHGEKIRF